MLDKKIFFIFFATGYLTSVLGASQSTMKFLKREDKNPKEQGFAGEIGFRSNALVENVGEVPGNEYFGNLNLSYKSLNRGNTRKEVSFKSRINNENVFEYSLNKAFIEFNYSTSRLAFGRMDLDWSYTDQVWGLGKINNRINFNYFDPGSEGLIGVFYDKKFQSGIDVSFFGSAIYVPELSQGMDINSKNGSITCKTAWCDAPSSGAEIEGRHVPIFYNVKYPDNSEVVFRHSAGLRLGYALDDRFSFNVYQLHKPENQISVSAEISVEPDLSVINAKITPQFYYHDVRGSNVEYKHSDHLKLYASHISIIPNKYPDGNQPFIQYTGIKPKKKREDYLSSGFFYRNVDWSAHAGYIARISEFDTESDILVDYPRWNQAINVGIKKQFSRKIKVALDIKYDMLTEDRLTMFRTDYYLVSGIVAAFGVNVIGTNKTKKSYWSKFENNDSVYSSLKYQF